MAVQILPIRAVILNNCCPNPKHRDLCLNMLNNKADAKKLDEACKKNLKITQKDHLYVSWIKQHGKGRVFYVSPSHQPQSYENACMLRFYLDGIHYAPGDLKRDDSPGCR